MSEMRMNGENVRDYTISLWDLQDSFIAVLKHSRANILGTIEEPTMSLVDDGTMELNLTIPMYIRESNGTLKENPIWYNTINGNLIADMRKLKVVFNIGTVDEEIFEFLITKVVETHENNQLKCEITAEGLAFHELGKQGYKIALEYENFSEIYDEWEKNKVGEEPIANLQFWNEEYGLGFLPYPGDDQPINANIWYYDIQMDWSSYSHASNRSTKKVYEEEYISSWEFDKDGNAIAGEPVSIQEKARIVNLAESNYYNLTQDLAKEFGVFCKYKYKYDENYHIIGRIVIYYNNFINENDGIIDFTYPYSSSAISRELDGTDLITKMYIKTIEDDSVENGVINIMNTEANLSGEDYLLNFDYMYNIGAINKDQYDGVKVYEAKIGEINQTLTNISNVLISYNLKKPKVEATLSISKAGIQAAENGRDENLLLMEALDIKDGENDGYITSPIRTASLISQGGGACSLNLTEKGILFSSVEIYLVYDYQSSQVDSSSRLPSGTPETDEFGNLIRINNLVCNSDSKTVFVKYKYNPRLYYQRVIDQWNLRLAKDQAAVKNAEIELEKINSEIKRLEQLQEQKFNQKKQLQNDFVKLMGPALREGSWTPDNYKNCENKVESSYNINNVSVVTNEDRISSIPLMWDVNLFDEEEQTYYKVGMAQTEVYYPYIPITSSLFNFICNHIDEQISIIYYDYVEQQDNLHEIERSRHISLGSGCQLGFKTNSIYSTTPEPVIIITDAKSMSEDEIALMESNGFIGVLDIQINDNTKQLIYNCVSFDSSIAFYTFTDNDRLAYLRFQIDTMYLKTGEKDLYVQYNNALLQRYYDYSLLSENGKFYITIKPNVFFKQSTMNANLQVTYTLSNASTAIYLDAKEVIKENSMPRVSYTVEPCTLNVNFMRTAYKKLNRIININDYELKFEGVQGYISSIDLNLDKPFEDKIEVKNYKTKFEDLFSSIIASTEQMQKNNNTFYAVSSVINADGTLRSDSLQNALDQVDLNYTFNNGSLSITNENGIQCISDSGIVAMRRGGIFTATDKNVDNEWIWNTGITPQGINAQMITVGQLDTNKIIVQAGDQVKFQLNDKGLYAYKSFLEDEFINELSEEERNSIISNGDVDKKQYVVHDANGLFLRMEPGANVINKDINGHYKLWNWEDSNHTKINEPIDRVEISWNGLVLRNYDNEKVFYADPDTGNLTIQGTLISSGGQIGDWIVGKGGLIRQHKEEEQNIITAEITPEGMNLFNILEVGADFGVIINSNNHRFRANGEYLGFEKINRITNVNNENLLSYSSLLNFEDSNIKIDGQIQLNIGENNYTNLLSNDNKITLSLLPAVENGVENGNSVSLVTTGEKYYWNNKSELALGTTEATAYRGDYGAAAYAHAVTNKGIEVCKIQQNTKTTTLVKIQTNSEGHIIASNFVTKADITQLGIPAQDTTYQNKTAVLDGTDVSLVTTGEKFIWNNAQPNIIESISVDDIELVIDENKSVNIDLSNKADIELLQMIAPDYDSNTIYKIGDFCIKDYKLYKSIITMEGTVEYNHETIYHVGEWCIYNDKIYQSLIDMETAEEWNDEHWQEVEWDISNWEETTLTAELQSIRNA